MQNLNVNESIVLPNCGIASHSQKDIEYKEILAKGLSNKDLEIKGSNIRNAGLGVFAKKNFKPFDVIEYCHLIVLKNREAISSDQSINLYAYGYYCSCSKCSKYGKVLSIPLGFGSIYNTALNKEGANAEFYVNIHTPVQIFYAIKNISAGEEIVTFYGEAYVKAYLSKNQ